MHKEFITYQDNQSELEAFVAYPSKEKRPLVILCHAWKGRDDFIMGKAQEVAEWGYVGFSLDMYGKGVLGGTKEENAALKRPFIENRVRLQERVVKAYETACGLPYVDSKQVVVLGYGFGGLCALDLGRTGVDLKGVVSIYGHFDPPPQALIRPILAKVLILHGYNDPIATSEELHRFEGELERAQIDWQVHSYGGAMHAFANPEASDPASGLLYHPQAAYRSWITVGQFLSETFASSNNT